VNTYEVTLKWGKVPQWTTTTKARSVKEARTWARRTGITKYPMHGMGVPFGTELQIQVKEIS